MIVRKIDLMHKVMGVCAGELCRSCSNFKRYRVGDKKMVRKCKVYGVTASEASDWNASYPACGCFNKAYNGLPIIKIEQREAEREEPLEGQVFLGGTE